MDIYHSSGKRIAVSAFFTDIFPALSLYYLCPDHQQKFTSFLRARHHGVLEGLGILGEDGLCKQDPIKG